jgi:hypothetical protein
MTPEPLADVQVARLACVPFHRHGSGKQLRPLFG